MYKYILLFALAFVSSCSGCQEKETVAQVVTHENFIPAPETDAVGQGVDILSVVSRKLGKLGQACDLMPPTTIAAVLGKTPDQISVVNSTKAGDDPESTSCFYKWDDPEDLFNAGIFVQLMKNPLADQEEYATYIEQMISGKRERGEQGQDGEVTLFKRFEGFGDDGSYSTEGGKYFWRLGDQVAFQIAFNTNKAPDVQYEMARSIAKELTLNYLK